MKNKVRLNPYRYHYPPSIFNVGGRSYTSTEKGWMQVPKDTSLAELKNSWTDTSIKTKKVGVAKVEEFEVISTGKVAKSYIVKNDNGDWSCTCPGYGFRRKCRHIEDTKKSFYPPF